MPTIRDAYRDTYDGQYTHDRLREHIAEFDRLNRCRSAGGRGALRGRHGPSP